MERELIVQAIATLQAACRLNGCNINIDSRETVSIWCPQYVGEKSTGQNWGHNHFQSADNAVNLLLNPIGE